MSKLKIGRVLSRTFKRDYGKHKNPLPDKLSFLADIKFYAITKCLLPDSERSQTRVEMLPRNLKDLAESYEQEKRLKKEKRTLNREKKELNNKLNSAKSSIKELEEQVKNLEYNNAIMMKNIEDGTVPKKSDFKSNLEVLEEKVSKNYQLPFQAGIPGGGKKR